MAVDETQTMDRSEQTIDRSFGPLEQNLMRLDFCDQDIRIMAGNLRDKGAKSHPLLAVAG